MKQYLDVLRSITTTGVEKEAARPFLPPTLGVSFAHIRMDMADGFPLLTTKKMFWKGVIHELLWFLNGGTNIHYLVRNKVNVWNKDAYGWYKHYAESGGYYGESINTIFKNNSDGTYSMFTFEEFVQIIKNTEKISNLPSFNYALDKTYTLGDLGKVYGHQWRNQNGVDQISDIMNGLHEKPYSRYHILDSWNKADFNEMALPPCHLLYQFIVRPLTFWQRVDLMFNPGAISTSGDLTLVEQELDDAKVPKFYLDLNMYQRSGDSFLGVPFNLASMSALLILFARAQNMIPGVANWIGGDTHIYVPHLPVVGTQLEREPFKLPELQLLKEINSLEDILGLTIDDFVIHGYKYHDKLDATLYTGLEEDWGKDE